MNAQTNASLYVLSAASGTGKSSLAKALVKSVKDMEISISHTTRPIRNGEKNAESYFFVSKKTFENMIAQKKFLEHAEVFGCYYGTSKDFILDKINAGVDIILDIDWQGARLVKEQMPNCLSIFLLPPSKDALRQRLEKRRRDPADIIENRLSLASSEMFHCSEFDYIVVNANFARALHDLQSIVCANRLKKDLQLVRHGALINELMKP